MREAQATRLEPTEEDKVLLVVGIAVCVLKRGNLFGDIE